MKYNKNLIVIWREDPQQLPQIYAYRTWKEALEDARKNEWKVLHHFIAE